MRAAGVFRRLFSSVSAASDAQVERKIAVPLAFHKFNAKIEPLDGEEKPPPIVFLHGTLASSNTYRSLVKRSDFAPKRDVYTLELRNHGASPHIMEMSYSSMTNDVRRFMDDERIQRVCLIGHSMGGKVAMHLALEDAERVSELIVVDIAPAKYDAEERRKDANFDPASDPAVAVRAMRAVDFGAIRKKSDVESALEQHGLTNKRVRQFVMTNLVADESRPGHYRWRLNIYAISDAFPSLTAFPLAECDPKPVFNGPTCFIRGGRSSFVPDRHIPLIKNMFPRSKIVTLADAGHWLQAEKPDDFCRELNSFLPETSSQATTS